MPMRCKIRSESRKLSIGDGSPPGDGTGKPDVLEDDEAPKVDMMS